MDAAQETREGKDAPAFPIVGIGASAGGLKAAGIFLEHTPADSGMAFVLVFHLDPKHKSEAAALLQRHTRMPVAQVEARTLLEPDHVYVIPPNHGLSLADGHLALTRRKRADGSPVVIDHFFRTLAEHAGEHAVGVVLSGTGSEGSQGLKAIKEAGGLAVVQDEGEAEYDGMPHSAIATGLIDFVLPVAEIPAKLLEVRDSPIDFALPDNDHGASENDADILHKIFVQLRTRGGHDFSHYKQNTVLRRIARRMQVHKLHDLGAYLEMLRATPAEAEAMFRELLISVTNFFRDPDAMDALVHDVAPKLCKRLEGQTVRVWVPGCATGEEAYSLAMLLGEACDGLAAPPRLQIFASDVDERALEVARRGLYPHAIVGDVSTTRLKRFFDHEGDGFVVKPFLRELILFARHDLLQDAPFSRLDLISCRNLLIYLKADIQPKIFALFHFALKPQSYLFLGNSESVGGSSKLFSEIDRKAKIFQSRRVPNADVPFPVLPSPREGARRSEPDAPRKRFEEIARDELLTGYAPPCVIVGENHIVTYISGRVGKYLEPGSGEANFNILDMAREGLRLELRSALYRAFHDGESLRRKPVRVRGDGRDELVGLTVRPLKDAEGHALVAFEELEANEGVTEPSRIEDGDGVIAELEAELSNTRESLQTSVEELETSNEELRASNEELQSLNEELQSATEELETGKEELQSTNEELLAVNHEMQVRNDELARSNSDLGNFLASTDIATLFLDGHLRVRRYAPRVTDIFNLIASDIGRPFAHLTHNLEAADLVADAERVLRDLVTVERELGSKDGHFYLTRLRPYRTTDNKLDGVVLTLVDVSERRHHEEEIKALNRRLEAKQAYNENIVATVREPLLVLDADLRVITANRAFYRTFNTTPESTEHALFYQLGDNQWDIPEFRRLLEEILPGQITIEDFEVRHDFGGGERIMLLNARRIQQQQEQEQQQQILLTFEDVTERKAAEKATRQLASIVDSSDDAIISKDLKGIITTWNKSAEQMFGYSAEEAIGRPIMELIIPPDRIDEENNILQRISRGETIDHFETVRQSKNGLPVEVSVTISPLVHAGRIVGASKIARNIGERKSHEKHRELLIQELNHRVKNTLATVQALAMQTFRGAGAQRELQDFDARLLALSGAHDVLTRESWKGADIGTIVRHALAMWDSGAKSRISTHGPELRLRPRVALALAMALHELATNALKYGALSNKRGKIKLDWAISGAAPASFRLHWQETGGPAVAKPKSRGFGSRLIEHALAEDLGGTVKLTFEKAGVECVVEVPLDEICEQDVAR